MRGFPSPDFRNLLPPSPAHFLYRFSCKGPGLVHRGFGLHGGGRWGRATLCKFVRAQGAFVFIRTGGGIRRLLTVPITEAMGRG